MASRRGQCSRNIRPTTTNKDKLATDTQTSKTPSSASAGEVLASKRRELGLTQEQLADRLGYSRSVVANAENNRGISGPLLDRYVSTFPNLKESILPLLSASEGSEAIADRPLGEVESERMLLRHADTTTDLDGTWFALWESTADNEAVVNVEEIDMRMRRGARLYIQNVDRSPDNPKGGYLWIAECRVFDNQHILGTYIAREPNVRSKGSMYLLIHRSGKYIDGQWIGCNYDHEWARGLVVFARTRDVLPDLLNKHRRSLPAMPYEVDG